MHIVYMVERITQHKYNAMKYCQKIFIEDDLYNAVFLINGHKQASIQLIFFFYININKNYFQKLRFIYYIILFSC